MRECLLLEPHVGVKIDLSSLRRLVSKPECNHTMIDSLMEKFHGRGVAQLVGCDILSYQGGTILPCGGRMLGNTALQRIGAEGTPTGTGEKGIT